MRKISSRTANVRSVRGRAVVRSGVMVSSPEDLDSSISAAIDATLAAIDACAATVAAQASGLTRMVASVGDDRTERQHFAEILALDPSLSEMGFSPQIAELATFFDELNERDREWDTRLVRARRNLLVMTSLANDLRLHMTALQEDAAFAVDAVPLDELRMRQGMDSARESERRRLAREIHDGPAQVLANALFIVGVSEKSVKRDPAAIPQQLSTIRDLLRDGITEIRRFMFELRPSLLENQGLIPTLRYCVSEYERVFGTHVSLTIDEGLPVLSGEQELCLFRVAQEALQNIRKHAGVSQAAISLSHQGRWLTLEVSDTGRGFDAGQFIRRTAHGAGIQGMRERARLIGARLQIDSAVGKGTWVRLTLPMDA